MPRTRRTRNGPQKLAAQQTHDAMRLCRAGLAVLCGRKRLGIGTKGTHLQSVCALETHQPTSSQNPTCCATPEAQLNDHIAVGQCFRLQDLCAHASVIRLVRPDCAPRPALLMRMCSGMPDELICMAKLRTDLHKAVCPCLGLA